MQFNFFFALMFLIYLAVFSVPKAGVSQVKNFSGDEKNALVRILSGSWINLRLQKSLDKFEISDSVDAWVRPYRSFSFKQVKSNRIVFVREVEFEKLYRDTVNLLIAENKAYPFFNIKLVKGIKNAIVAELELDMRDSLLHFVNPLISRYRYVKSQPHYAGHEPLYGYFNAEFAGTYMVQDGNGHIVAKAAKFSGDKVSGFEDFIDYDFGDAAFFLKDKAKNKYLSLSMHTKTGKYSSYACKVSGSGFLVYAYENPDGNFIRIKELRYTMHKEK